MLARLLPNLRAYYYSTKEFRFVADSGSGSLGEIFIRGSYPVTFLFLFFSFLKYPRIWWRHCRHGKLITNVLIGFYHSGNEILIVYVNHVGTIRIENFSFYFVIPINRRSIDYIKKLFNGYSNIISYIVIIIEKKSTKEKKKKMFYFSKHIRTRELDEYII